MKSFFADLHIHIGRTEVGTPVKISAGSNLTFYNIAQEASKRKGIDMIGIIDCHAPKVQEEIIRYLDLGEMTELEGGGIRYHDTTVLLGCELEVRDAGFGAAHLLAYLPDLASMKKFTAWIKERMKNVELSSQRIYAPAKLIQEAVTSLGGIMVPAHIFTPYKSAYGSAATRMDEFLDLDLLTAVELGLSADTTMAGCIMELDAFAFLTNSDAHSLPKIGREYNQLEMAEPTFRELVKALRAEEGRGIIANYGLNPYLGKYHKEVSARIMKVADRDEGYVAEWRPPYFYQVPLEFIPGLGPKMLNSLLEHFGTEMNVIHHVQASDLEEVAGVEIAKYILQARENTLTMEIGSGGKYGKVVRDSGIRGRALS